MSNPIRNVTYHKHKSNKYGVISMTLVSALLFCSIVIVASLSPLAETGPTTNEFNSVGMWAAVGFVLACYALPLIIYMLGADAMRKVMAVFCGIGLLMSLTSIVVIKLMTVFGETTTDFQWVIGLCVASFIVNVIWFIVAFRSSSRYVKLNDRT